MKPWVKVLAFIALLAIAGVAVWAYGEQQFTRGGQVVDAAWTKRENKTLRAANKRIADLEEAARDQERKHAAAMAAASTNYQKEIAHVQADRDRAIAALRSGALRLYDNGIATASAGADGSETGPAGASAGRCDGQARGQLSIPFSEFLVGLLGEADQVVKQLTACQAVVESDRSHQGEIE